MHIPAAPAPGRVLGLYFAGDGSAYYRLIVPLRALPSASWSSLQDVTEAQLRAADVVVISRPGGDANSMRRAIVDLRGRWRCAVLVDYDDDVLAVPADNPLRPTESHLAGVRVALAEADGVLCTNETLGQRLRLWTTGPIAILPNLVCATDWPAPAPAEQPLIVLAGSQSHVVDWRMVLPALAQIRAERPDVAIRIVGCDTPEVRQVATDWRPFVELANYADQLTGAWIGLAPLPASHFNVAKSPIKAYEYALAGAAVIGSPTQYGGLLTNRGQVVADQPAAWYSAIVRYLDDAERRTRDAARLRDYVIRTADAERRRDHIGHVFTRILASIGATTTWHS